MVCKNRSYLKVWYAWAILTGMVAIGFSLGACSDDTGQRITLGIVAGAPFGGIVDNFKTAMADLDYVEGRHVDYIYHENLGYRSEVIDSEIKKLLARKVDMLITIGNLPTLKAKHAVDGTNVPVVFTSVTDPVGEGMVASISHPGGNLTGVQAGGSAPKALEWLTVVVPNVRKVCLPYNPDDSVSVLFLKLLAPSARQMNVELVPAMISSVEDAVAVIENLPSDVQAIFRIPSPTLDLENTELSRAAIERKLPMIAGHPLDEDVLLMLWSDFSDTGTRAGRIVCQIMEGLEPADLPVETADVSMSVNLKTARAIGLHISDIVLHQADRIIR
jgi:putative ABC transport system substrate-binding protein